MFCDVSGFTALCEAMAAKGPAGDEYLARHLNSYFEQLVRVLASQGGDVFKYAGDAILVVWPPSTEDLQTLSRRAAQCALEVDEKLQGVKMEEGVTLNVKVGVGVGEICIIHVGGQMNRMEYLAVGEPLVQAFHAEGHASKCEVVAHPAVWALVKDFFDARITDDGFAFLEKCRQPLRKASVALYNSRSSLSPAVIDRVISYIPKAVVPFVQHKEEKWAGELRRITVLFVNLGLPESELNKSKDDDASLQLVHKVLSAVQVAVYQNEGSVNKFLMDDKGSTLVAVFGLPPLAHEDDSARAVKSARLIIDSLTKLGRSASIGITTGQAFCGIVGTRGSREYSVLGDTVNLSARLMQHAMKSGNSIILEGITERAARGTIELEDLGKITVKGKSEEIHIFRPMAAKKKVQTFAAPAEAEASTYSLRGLLKRVRYTGNVDTAIATLCDDAYIVDPCQLKILGPDEWASVPGNLRPYLAEGSQCPHCVFGGDDDDASSSKLKMGRRGSRTPSSHTLPRKSVMPGKRRSSKIVNSDSSSANRAPSVASDGDAVGAHVTLKERIIAHAVSHSYNVHDDADHFNPFPTTDVIYNVPTIATVSSHASKLIKILLPFDLGVLTMSCKPLLKVKALNFIVWTLLKKLHLIPGFANPRFYSYYRQPSNEKLANDVLVSTLFDKDTAASASSTVPATLTLLMEHNDQDASDSVTRARLTIMHSVYQLQRQGVAHTVIIEGDVGMGKTHALTSCLTDGLANVHAATCKIVAPSAPSLETIATAATLSSKPQFVWTELTTSVMNQHITAVVDTPASGAATLTRRMPSTRIVTSDERGALLKTIIDACASSSSFPSAALSQPANSLIAELPHIVAELDMSIAGVAAAAAPADGSVHAAVVNAVFCIVHYCASFGGASPQNLVLFVDDVTNCSQASWKLFHLLTKHVNSAVLVLAMRSFNQRYAPPFTSHEAASPVRRCYDEMRAMAASRVSHIKLTPRSAACIRRIACRLLGPLVLSLAATPMVDALIVDVASGNPLAASTLVRTLVEGEFVFVHGEDVVASHKLEYFKESIPIPGKLQVVLQSHTDRLSQAQKLMLKIAAVISVNGGGVEGTDDAGAPNKPFSCALLKKCFPIRLENIEQLDAEFRDLVDMNFFAADSTANSSGEVVYQFSETFVRACMLKRMIGSQTAQLEASVSLHIRTFLTHRGQGDDDVVHIATAARVHAASYGYSPATGHGNEIEEVVSPAMMLLPPGSKVSEDSVYEGFLHKRGGDARAAWKKRYFILWDDRIEYFKAKGDRKPAGTISICASTQIRRAEYKDHTFGVIPEDVDGAREYVMKVKPAELAQHWVNMVAEQIHKATSNVLAGMRRHRDDDDSD
jgi:class 3 adenylate cyclase